MISDKNRFKTTEKLWNLDDKQLTSPVHDAMVLWMMEEANASRMLEPLTNPIEHTDFIRPERLDKLTFDIRSEIPFQAQNGFINAYGDLEISRYETIKEKYYECKVSEEILHLIKKATTVGDIMEILKQKYMITEFTPSLDSVYYEKRDFYHHEDLELKDWKYQRKSYYGGYDLPEMKLLDFFNNFTPLPPSMEIHDVTYWIKHNNYYKWITNHIICLIEVKPYIESFGQVLRQINSYKAFWNPRTFRDCRPYVCLFTLDTQFDSQFESQGIKVLHPPEDFDIEKVMEHYGLK